MTVKELTSDQLKKIFCNGLAFHSSNRANGDFVQMFEEHYGKIDIEWQEDRWYISNEVAYVEVTQTIKFRCGSNMYGQSNAMIFDLIEVYNLLKEYEVI